MQEKTQPTRLARLRRLLRRQKAAPDPPHVLAIPDDYKDLADRLRAQRADRADAPSKPASHEALTKAPLAAGQDAAVDVIFLRQTLLNHLDEADLTAIAAAVDCAWPAGGGKGRKVQALLRQCERERKLPALLAAGAARRADVTWQPADG